MVPGSGVDANADKPAKQEVVFKPYVSNGTTGVFLTCLICVSQKVARHLPFAVAIDIKC